MVRECAFSPGRDVKRMRQGGVRHEPLCLPPDTVWHRPHMRLPTIAQPHVERWSTAPRGGGVRANLSIELDRLACSIGPVFGQALPARGRQKSQPPGIT